MILRGGNTSNIAVGIMLSDNNDEIKTNDDIKTNDEIRCLTRYSMSEL